MHVIEKKWTETDRNLIQNKQKRTETDRNRKKQTETAGKRKKRTEADRKGRKRKETDKQVDSNKSKQHKQTESLTKASLV